MRFELSTFEAMTIRDVPTTQISIRVSGWPDDEFLLWMPEAVGELWVQWHPVVGRQTFETTAGGGLKWKYLDHPEARIEARLTPVDDQRLMAEVEVTNQADRSLPLVRAQNCLHLSRAPRFDCDDFSRIYLRVEGVWRALESLEPTAGLPMYYREGFLEARREDSWRGQFAGCNQKPRADHPLMVCLAADGRACIGTASDDYQCVFHNQEAEYLRCIHSQQAPVPELSPGETVVFRQLIYFIDGDLDACVAACEEDVSSKRLQP
ncbi:MAG TPA: hypothetical protein QGH10_27435 [Armatimonadota bacterium]|jgi:hypothetical protein|nr:hypothetical protein [Armatimonadota bacterium]